MECWEDRLLLGRWLEKAFVSLYRLMTCFISDRTSLLFNEDSHLLVVERDVVPPKAVPAIVFRIREDFPPRTTE